MGLINENGQSVSREDLELAKRMMRDSIDSHLKRLQWYIKSNGDPVKAMVEPLIKEYQDGLSQIDRRFDEAFRSGEDIKITDFMTSFSDDIADKAASKLNKNDEYYFDFLIYSTYLLIVEFVILIHHLFSVFLILFLLIFFDF